MENGFKIRFATEKDASLLLELIKELAKYEKLTDEVTASEKTLAETIFKKKYAEVIIAELNEEPIRFALFFHNFSTFLGKPGIYIEDLYIKERFRCKGYGKQIFSFLANLAVERKCGRLEWWVLDWNVDAINFYKSLGARAMDEWTVFRISGSELQNLSKTN